MSAYDIRRARPGDAAEIARLTTELGYPASVEQTAPRLAALLPLIDRFLVVVAETDGHLLGWIAAEHRLLLHSEARAELIGLVIGPDARRRGVGQALVTAAEKWAVGRGLAVISVRSSTARSESHPFYERLGYRRNRTQHSYVKEFGGI